MYGGLGDRHSFGLHNTSHYMLRRFWRGACPRIGACTSPQDSGFGVNDTSRRFILRWGVSRDIDGFGAAIRRLFAAQQ